MTITTEQGYTQINVDLTKVMLDNGQCFHHLEIEFHPRIDTDIVTKIRINTISKNDLKSLSKIFNDLSKSKEFKNDFTTRS